MGYKKVIILSFLFLLPTYVYSWSGVSWGTITRAQIIANAYAMINPTWIPNNTFTLQQVEGSTSYPCTYYSGTQYSGEAYTENNCQSWSEFSTSVNSTPAGNYNYGNDCSGFLSICWQLTTRESTGLFYAGMNISPLSTEFESLGSIYSAAVVDLLQGDALNSSTLSSPQGVAHVVIFNQYENTGNPDLLEQTPPDAKENLGRSWLYLTSYYYQPMRRLSITGDVIVSAPTLSSPSYGGTSSSTSPTFSWSSATNANEYWLMVANNISDLPTNPGAQNCPNCVISGTTNLNSYTDGNTFPGVGKSAVLTAGNVYYWEVQAFNSNSSIASDAYSSQWSFTAGTGAIPTPTYTATKTVTPTITPTPVPPSISAFAVTPSSITLGQSFTITYTVSDVGGPGLLRVELWLATGNGTSSDTSWAEVAANTASGSGPVNGNFANGPTSVGSYWYGLHAVDINGNYETEKMAGLGPLQRNVVANQPTVTYTPTYTPPWTPTYSYTYTRTFTPTFTPTTPTNTPTWSYTPTRTYTPGSPTNTPTWSNTPTITNTPTPTNTFTITYTLTITFTPTITYTPGGPTNTPTNTPPFTSTPTTNPFATPTLSSLPGSYCYPQPATNTLNIVYPCQTSDVALFYIFTTSGSLADYLTTQATVGANNQITFSTASYAPGIYYYVIRGQTSGLITKGRFMVVK